MSVGTAFHPRTAPLNRKMQWREWAGYFASSVYADFHDIEYNAIREAAAVIDVSPLYKYRVTGPDALRLADRVITRDATRIKVGQVYYTPWCDEHGKVIDDGTVHRVGERGAPLDRGRPAVPLAHPERRRPRRRRSRTSPSRSRRSRSRAPSAAPSWRRPPARTSRTSATSAAARARSAGCRSTSAAPATPATWATSCGSRPRRATDAWDALFAAGKAYAIRPAGMHALDVVRLEAGMVMLEVDYTSARHAMNPEQNYSPFEIGLGRLVSFDKGDYVGRRALQAEVAAGGPAPAPRRPPARLVRHRGPVRRPGPAAGHQPLRGPLAGPGLRRRAPGGQGDLPRLEPDPQAGARPGLRAGPLRAGGHQAPGGVDGRGPPRPRHRPRRGAAVPRPPRKRA